MKARLWINTFNLIYSYAGGNPAANAVKGIEPDSSDSSDNEAKDPYKLKDELAAVGMYITCKPTFRYIQRRSVS